MKNGNIKKLKPYWKKYQEIEDEFFKKVNKLEEQMRTELKDDDIEFAYAKFGGGVELYFGIGYGRNGRNDKEMLHRGELNET